MSQTKTRITLLAAVALAAVTAGPTAASAAPERGTKPKPASVKGSGDFWLTFYPDGDRRSFSFDAQAAPYTRPITGFPDGTPADARGKATLVHEVKESGYVIWAEADVDCMTTSPGYAALTATITKSSEDPKEWVGRRLGFSVYDAGPDRDGRTRDRVGFSWAIVNMDKNEQGEWFETKAGTCMAPAPFSPVSKGGFTVRHADLPG
ncbi:hypothetical protein [Spirillospora sp. NPDC047279]|uniref:hypothetical protein n=1 Tax=Spirillospora sp. NPDC047279 TaxID=3155478 RepID=UPI0033DE9840